MIISETYAGAADDADLLKAPSRLQVIPFNGRMSLEISATKCDETDFVQLTIQQPDGEVPIEDARVPANGYSDSSDVLHNDTETIFQIDVIEQGHLIIKLDVTGTVRWIARVSLVSDEE